MCHTTFRKLNLLLSSSEISIRRTTVVYYYYLVVSHKATGIDHIPSELIQTGGGKLYEEIHKLIVFIWKKEELIQEWKESIIVPIHKKGDKMDCDKQRNFTLV